MLVGLRSIRTLCVQHLVMWPCAAVLDEEAQSETAAPVAVAAGGLDGLDEGCGQHVGSFHRIPLLVSFQAKIEMECAAVT